MASLVVFYKKPADPQAFDRYYFETHIPLAKKLPGLRKYEVSQGPIVNPAASTDIHLAAMLTFDDAAAVMRAYESPEGQATAADVQKIATAGVDIVFFDTREV